MNITCDKWTIRHFTITNREINETRTVKEIPTADAIAYMPFDACIRRCSAAFMTGIWPTKNTQG